jgi:hypothetical protein
VAETGDCIIGRDAAIANLFEELAEGRGFHA